MILPVVLFHFAGFNSDSRGFVDTSLQRAIGRGFQSRANDLANPGKLTLMLGMFVHEKYHGVFHGKAINLARKLGQEYDNVLKRYDALVLPTIIRRIPKIPGKDELDFGKLRSKGLLKSFNFSLLVYGRGLRWLFF